MPGKEALDEPPSLSAYPAVLPVPDPGAPAARRPISAYPTVLPVRSRHSPLFALLLSAVVPGAGQAYNGQPIKGFFLFFLSILTIPYLINLIDAYSNAARLKNAGISTGCSGFLWVCLQFWLAFNTALLAVIVLTIAGVIQ